MKQKILSVCALVIALVSLVVSVGALVHSVQNVLPNKINYIIQLVAVSVIVLICTANAIAVFGGKDEPHNDAQKEDEAHKASGKKLHHKATVNNHKKPVKKSQRKGSKYSAKRKGSKSSAKRKGSKSSAKHKGLRKK